MSPRTRHPSIPTWCGALRAGLLEVDGLDGGRALPAPHRQGPHQARRLHQLHLHSSDGGGRGGEEGGGGGGEGEGGGEADEGERHGGGGWRAVLPLPGSGSHR